MCGGGAAMKMRASLVQALCKHRASYVQANAICVQATLRRIAGILCFCDFSALSPPPKHPYYNIKGVNAGKKWVRNVIWARGRPAM